jgi:hypothetical protein
MSDPDVGPRRPGRRTKEEEVAEALRDLGIDPDNLGDVPGAMPETFAEMRDGFMQLIWQQKGSLKGTALVQALNALARLAEANRDADDEKTEREPTVAEVLVGVPNLAREKRDEILLRERAKLENEIAEIDGVLNG